MKKLAWIIFISSCLLFSFQPVKYIFGDGPGGFLNAKPTDSYMYLISFYIHIIFGGIALLTGWVQFSKKFRIKHLRWHRRIGKIYVTSVLISGPFAFYIGFFVFGGLTAQIGFTFGTLLWVIFTFMAYKAIIRRNIARHRALMMYSYAGTFAAVTLRIWLGLLMTVTGFSTAYVISIWLSWIPNIIVVYFILRKKSKMSELTYIE